MDENTSLLADLLFDYGDEWHITERDGKALAIRYPERVVPQFLLADNWQKLREQLDEWAASHQ